jgi:hypothetical protein
LLRSQLQNRLSSQHPSQLRNLLPNRLPSLSKSKLNRQNRLQQSRSSSHL